MNCENCQCGKTTSPATFMKEITGTPTTYPDESSPSIVVPWPAWRIIFQNVGPNAVYISFDGKQDHAMVYGNDPGTETPSGMGQLVLHRCPVADGVVRIWIRSPEGSSRMSAVAER